MERRTCSLIENAASSISITFITRPARPPGHRPTSSRYERVATACPLYAPLARPRGSACRMGHGHAWNACQALLERRPARCTALRTPRMGVCKRTRRNVHSILYTLCPPAAAVPRVQRRRRSPGHHPIRKSHKSLALDAPAAHPGGGVDMNYSNERRASVRAAALDVILKLIGPSSSGSVCGRAVCLLEHTHTCTCTHYNNCPGRAECSTTATATPTTVWLL